MSITKNRAFALTAAIAVGGLILTGCGAGGRTASKNATAVSCDYTAPDSATTVNVLAYNSSAVDPFTNTMVSSCTKGKVAVKHDPIDFGGQVTKTTATLSGSTGSYDINKSMRAGMSYEGNLYALPMQAQMFVMAYRADVFDNLGIKVPTTFDEMIAAAKAIKAAGVMDYPIALPWLATSDIGTSFQAAMNSLDADFVSKDGTVTLDTPEAKQALQSMLSLKPYMDPQVTTFDQPKVQQQMFNGTAAMSIMFSGRMNDLTLTSNSKLSDSFKFAAPPKVNAAAKYSYDRLSIDGWSIPFNTKLDPDMLFVMMASAVSEDASKASIPAAYPARNGMVTADNSPYGKAATDSIASAMPPIASPVLASVTTEIRPILVQILAGNLTINDGAAQMQAVAQKIVG